MIFYSILLLIEEQELLQKERAIYIAKRYLSSSRSET